MQQYLYTFNRWETYSDMSPWPEGQETKVCYYCDGTVSATWYYYPMCSLVVLALSDGAKSTTLYMLKQAFDSMITDFKSGTSI